MKQKILIFILLFFIFMNNTISGDLETNLEDTVDKIEHEAVLACMQIAEQFILDIDQSVIQIV